MKIRDKFYSNDQTEFQSMARQTGAWSWVAYRGKVMVQGASVRKASNME